MGTNPNHILYISKFGIMITNAIDELVAYCGMGLGRAPKVGGVCRSSQLQLWDLGRRWKVGGVFGFVGGHHRDFDRVGFHSWSCDERQTPPTFGTCPGPIPQYATSSSIAFVIMLPNLDSTYINEPGLRFPNLDIKYGNESGPISTILLGPTSKYPSLVWVQTRIAYCTFSNLVA